MKKKRGMQINIKISNKAVYTLIIVGILAIISVGVFALGSIPNPGHPISELQTCEEGESLQVVEGEWACVSGGNYEDFTRVSAYKESDQVVSLPGPDMVTFESEVYDTNNEFLDSKFTAKESGYYFIYAQIYGQELGEFHKWVLGIKKGAGYLATTEWISPGDSSWNRKSVFDIQRIAYLHEGESVYIDVSHSQTNDRIIYSGVLKTYLEIYRLS
jgi:hypothetical protein